MGKKTPMRNEWVKVRLLVQFSPAVHLSMALECRMGARSFHSQGQDWSRVGSARALEFSSLPK